ncbi:unnamed protein product [Musa acuminata subsp. burmannicoides]
MVFEKKRVVKRAILDKEQDNYNVIDGEKEAKPETYSPSPHAPPRVSSSCMTSPYDDSPRLREREGEEQLLLLGSFPPCFTFASYS